MIRNLLALIWLAAAIFVGTTIAVAVSMAFGAMP